MSRDIFADAARRHAHALPGHILLAAEPSAIPVSALTVDVLAELAEELEASSKYALRAMLNGIDTVEDLQLFLGLDEGDTARVVAALLIVVHRRQQRRLVETGAIRIPGSEIYRINTGLQEFIARIDEQAQEHLACSARPVGSRRRERARPPMFCMNIWTRCGAARRRAGTPT